ncbi:MAG TPA: CAP domain-containing protein [Gemmatimonadales bacterium]
MAGTSPDVLRRAVVCLVNQQRTRRGLPRLHENRLLNASAQGWTNQMVSHDVFSHGASFAGRISAVGFDWQTAGENIATGFTTPAAVVRAWMGSPEHCRNILTPNFLDVGVGVSGLGVGSASGPGTWTEDFGLPMMARTPSGNWGPADGCPY